MSESQITSTEYAPDQELAELLSEFAAETTLTTHSDEKMQGAEQKKFTVHHRDLDIGGTETYSAYAVMGSYEGHLGFAACLILTHAINLGEPTHCYVDSSETLDKIREMMGTDDVYRDMTAEWFTRMQFRQDSRKNDSTTVSDTNTK
ncbi:hypothetical protein [Halocatena halophila]|uniref:hypothetical protein n=1 Tax=Halocatena halophila TaxID=2814576 RepID=UPI002ED3EE7A